MYSKYSLHLVIPYTAGLLKGEQSFMDIPKPGRVELCWNTYNFYCDRRTAVL